jgi:hypothetical protein
MESQSSANGSAVDMPVSKIPEAAVDYVRARRELKIQEMMLEGMLRQFEIAKLDVAKEGPTLQQVDVAVPPDYKSKPSRALITARRHRARVPRRRDLGRRARLRRADRRGAPERESAWRRMVGAWRAAPGAGAQAGR